MKYNFETFHRRQNAGSNKWDEMKQINPNVSDDIVPFSVADMELNNAPEITEGLQEYLNDHILGYASPTLAFKDAVANWMDRRHNWQVDMDTLITTPGVVPAFFMAIKAFTEPGDGVIVMSPVYYPFYMAIEENQRHIVDSPLICDNNYHYTIDFADFEKKAQEAKNKVLLFCSPHNPVGRVWTKEELKRVGDICLENNVIVLSDEIHNDLIMPGHKHTVFATLGKEYEHNCMMFTAPSKSFNLAGMQSSNMFIANPTLRARYQKVVTESLAMSRTNILGYQACLLAYTKGEPWLEQLIQHLDKNQQIWQEAVTKEFPQIRFTQLEGTYLQWMDFNALGFDHLELERIMQQEAMLYFDEGYIFGDSGRGFERINLACTTPVLLDAADRLITTLKKHV